jgi:hypothetical protein
LKVTERSDTEALEIRDGRTRICVNVKASANQSANEHDLAGRSGLENLLVGAGRIGERQFLANDWAQRAVLKAGKNPSVDVRLFPSARGD